MYATWSDSARTTADLAATLTDFGLKFLADADVQGNSVEVELKLWHALQAELELEIRWRRLASGQRKNIPLDEMVRRVVRRTARRVAGEEHLVPEYHSQLPERACGRLCHV
jgi:hypothetical protein